MTHVARLSIQGNPNIGLFVYATDTFALVGKSASEQDMEIIKSVLKVPVYPIMVAGTGLAGIFLTGNSKYLLMPNICYDQEIEQIESICAKYDVKVKVVNTKFTALSNNMMLTDTILLANTDMEDKVLADLKKDLGLKIVERVTIADTDVVGSAMVFTTKGGLIHPDIANDSIEHLEELLGIKFTLGTVNYGSPYVKSGIVVNSNGFLIGKTSSGPEVTNADEALGFVNNE